MNKTPSTAVAESALSDLFTDELRDILWAEKQLLTALPKMAGAARMPKLQQAFKKHLGETEKQVTRLNDIFASLGLAPRAKKCEAMVGLLKEADELGEEYADSPALDAALISAAQKVEHYEIATYGTLRAFARRLGHTQAVDLLTQTIDEESNADETLTQIAESSANETAVQAE